MGTRSLTKFYSEYEEHKPIACMYRQYDGYPTGHGKEMAEFLNKRRYVNGFGDGDNGENAANGMSCLAAQAVCHFKLDHNGPQIGGIYLYPPDAADCGQEYEYHIGVKDKNWFISVTGYKGKVVFAGDAKGMLKWIDNGASEDNIFPELTETLMQLVHQEVK